MIAALARPPLTRLLRGRRAWLGVAAWSALAFVFAVAARERGSARGADHVLIDTYGALALPLLSYVIVGAALASKSLRASTAALVAFGAEPVRAAAAAIAVAAASSAVVGAFVAAAVAAVAHGIADPPRLHDAATSAYVGALGGAAYAAWFSLGASFGRRGGARVLLLVVDWILGATAERARSRPPEATFATCSGARLRWICPSERAPRPWRSSRSRGRRSRSAARAGDARSRRDRVTAAFPDRARSGSRTLLSSRRSPQRPGGRPTSASSARRHCDYRGRTRARRRARSQPA